MSKTTSKNNGIQYLLLGLSVYKKAGGTAKKSRTCFLQIHTGLETSISVTAVAVLGPPVLSQQS